MLSQKRLKILHLSYDHPENPWCGGGGAKRTWAVNKILSKKHDITVFCGAFTDATTEEEPFKVRLFGKARGYKESRLKFIFGTRQLDSRPYDLIVEDFSAFSPSLLKTYHKPLITIVHYYLGLRTFRFRPVHGLVSVLSERLLLRRKRSVILVSKHLEDAIHTDARSTVVSPGVDIPDDLPHATEDYALFLGRIDIEIKGIDTLIQAWAKLPDNMDLLPLYIAGGGDQSKIKSLICTTGARNVHFLGHLQHEEAMEAINRAAFLCIPSRMEGCGIVLYEALALGKPVIASSIPSFRNLITDGVSGLLIPPGDHLALYSAIENLLTNQSMRSRLTEGAQMINKDFQWQTVAEKQDRFYQEVISMG